MDRELLIEIGCEEIPASWLPGLTTQLATQLDARLKDARLDARRAGGDLQHAAPADRARRPKLAERQTDLEELVTGPPVSARRSSRTASRRRRRSGFAKKYGVEVGALERSRDAEGQLPRRTACTSAARRPSTCWPT